MQADLRFGMLLQAENHLSGYGVIFYLKRVRNFSRHLKQPFVRSFVLCPRASDTCPHNVSARHTICHKYGRVMANIRDSGSFHDALDTKVLHELDRAAGSSTGVCASVQCPFSRTGPVGNVDKLSPPTYQPQV